MSVDERLISRVRSAGSVVGSVSAVGFMDPHFWPQVLNYQIIYSHMISQEKSQNPKMCCCAQ